VDHIGRSASTAAEPWSRSDCVAIAGAPFLRDDRVEGGEVHERNAQAFEDATGDEERRNAPIARRVQGAPGPSKSQAIARQCILRSLSLPEPRRRIEPLRARHRPPE